MLKIQGINESKLKAAGFKKTPNGFAKEIPNCFRFVFTLYILPDDIYGTFTQTGGVKSLDYETWLDRLSFRDLEKAKEVQKLISSLEASGAITTLYIE